MKKRVICVRTRLVRESSVLYESKDGSRSIRSPEEAAAFAAPFFDDSDKEMIFICVLNVKKEPVSMEMTAKGATDWCRTDIAQVFKTAILANGSGILCFHNHPSGVIQHFIYSQNHSTHVKFNKAPESNKVTYIPSDSLIPEPFMLLLSRTNEKRQATTVQSRPVFPQTAPGVKLPCALTSI